MHKSILLAASIATALVLATAHRAVEAQGQPGAATAKPKAAAKAKAPRAAAKPRKRTAAKGFRPMSKGPGQCGTFMYWKGGKCVDARAPKK